MTDRPFMPRRPPDDRSYPRPPFRPPVPTPRPNSEPAPTSSSVRLKDGEREIEVSGTPIFVRQVLDDLPTLLARLRGETPPTPAAIRMPAPSAVQPPAAHPSTPEVHAPVAEVRAPQPEAPPHAPEIPIAAAPSGETGADGDGISLEEQVLTALRGAKTGSAPGSADSRCAASWSGPGPRWSRATTGRSATGFARRWWARHTGGRGRIRTCDPRVMSPLL